MKIKKKHLFGVCKNIERTFERMSENVFYPPSSATRHSHFNGFSQVSSEDREHMLKSQRDAMLRRRKEQLHSGFIRNIDPVISSVDLQSKHNVVPTVKTFKISSKTISHGKEGSEQSSSHSSVQIQRIKSKFKTTNKSLARELDEESFPEEELTILKKVADEGQISVDYHEPSNEDLNSQEKIEQVPFVATNAFNVNERKFSIGISSEMNLHQLHDEVISNTENEGINHDESIQDEFDTTNDNVRKDLLWGDINWDDKEEVRRTLMSPCPKDAGMIKCYIRRNKGKAKLFPEYRVYLQDGDIFLMTSKKRAKKQTSNYLISMGRNDFGKNSSNIIGKLRANFVGTEFQIYDNGTNPKHTDPFFDEKNKREPRSELGAILYSSNILGNRGPRKMQVCINKLGIDEKITKKWQPVHKDEEMIQCFKHKAESAHHHLNMYENRQPRWNEDMGSYVLNFNNRVNLASVKNFQLIEPNGDDENVVLQFGKASNDDFIMDVKWPMSLFQAFAISLSSFDSKLACD